MSMVKQRGRTRGGARVFRKMVLSGHDSSGAQQGGGGRAMNRSTNDYRVLLQAA